MSSVYVGPHEWWHVSPLFPTLGPLKTLKIPTTWIFISPHNANIICHRFFIGTNHMLPRVPYSNQSYFSMCPTREERKGSSTFGFGMKSFVNLYQCSPIVLTLSTFPKSCNIIHTFVYHKFAYCNIHQFIDHWFPICWLLIIDVPQTSNMWSPMCWSLIFPRPTMCQHMITNMWFWSALDLWYSFLSKASNP